MDKEEKLLTYLQMKSAYQSVAIPTKDDFTFISKLTGIPQIWKLDDSNNPIQYAELQDRVVSFYHSPKGDKTVVGMDHKGNEKQQIYLLGNDGSKVEALVNESEYFHNLGGWSPDGKQILFSSNRRHPGYFDLFVLNIETKEMTKVFEYDGNCIPLSWLPDGESVLINIPETNIDDSIYILHLKSGRKVKVGKKDVLARYQSVVASKNNKDAYVLTDLEAETMYLSAFTLNEPEKLHKLVHVEKWDMEEIKLSPSSNKLIYTLNVGGIYELFIYNIASKEVFEIEGISKGVIDSLSWLNEKEFIFTLVTPTSPGDIWKYSLENKELERLTSVSRSKVENLLIEPEINTFQSFDGLEVPYFYYEKDSGRNKPAVLYVHGGPESQTRAEYNPVIQFLADQGFAVAAPNVRGSSGYGRTFTKLDDVRKRMDSVEDLTWLVDDLVQRHDVDHKKIGVMGRSYGGFMVLAALTHYPKLWAAGVNIVGISHFKTFLENTGPWRRRLRSYEYGTLEEDTDFFEEIAPLNNSHKIKAPLIVFHGRNDTRVPVSEAEQLVADMKKRGQTVEFTVFDDEGHQTEKVKNHIKMNSKIIEFLNKYL